MHSSYNEQQTSYIPPIPAADADGCEVVPLEFDGVDTGGWDHGFGNGSRFSSPWAWFPLDSPEPVHQFHSYIPASQHHQVYLVNAAVVRMRQQIKGNWPGRENTSAAVGLHE